MCLISAESGDTVARTKRFSVKIAGKKLCRLLTVLPTFDAHWSSYFCVVFFYRSAALGPKKDEFVDCFCLISKVTQGGAIRSRGIRLTRFALHPHLCFSADLGIYGFLSFRSQIAPFSTSNRLEASSQSLDIDLPANVGSAGA
jgi:hypothetical protein